MSRVLILLTLILVFYGRFLWPNVQLIVTPDFGKSDSWHSSISAKVLLSRSLHEGKIPIWTQGIGRGVPVLAEGLIGALYPPHLIVFTLFDAPTGIVLMYILNALTIGTGMYLWMSSRGYSGISGLFAAITITFSAITITQLTHLALLPAQALIPWILWATRRLALSASPRSIAIFAILLALQILTGYPQAVFIGLLFAGLYYLYLTRHTVWYKAAVNGLVALFLGVALSAIQLIPSFEYLQNSGLDKGYTPTMASFFSYPWSHVQTFFAPFLLGDPRSGSYPSFLKFNGSIFWENTGYVGLLPIVLICILFFTHRRTVIPHLAGLLAAFLLMLGKFSPLYLVYSFFPFSLFRVPSRFLWIFTILLVSLSSLSFHNLWRKRVIRALLMIAFLLHTYQLMSTWWNYHAVASADVWFDDPQVLQYTTSGDLLYSIGASNTHNAFFLKSGWSEIAPFYSLRNTMAANSNITFGRQQMDAYIGRPIRRNQLADQLLAGAITQTDTEATVSAFGDKLLDLFSVTKIISTIPLSGYDLQPVAIISENQITIDVYDNPGANPMAYIATDEFTASTLEDAEKILRSDAFVPSRSVLTTKKIELIRPSTETEVTVNRWTEEEIEITTESNGEGILVVALTYYPGWQATIDGSGTDLFPVNIRFTGTRVKSGTHTVRLRYKPSSLIAGLVTSTIALILVLVLMVFPVRQPSVRISQTLSRMPPRHRRSRGR